jgi:hypothetical protein
LAFGFRVGKGEKTLWRDITVKLGLGNRSFRYVKQFVQQYRFGTEIKVALGIDFEVDFRLLSAVSGPYGTVRTANGWHGNRGTKEAVHQYGFGMEIKTEFSGTVLVL